MDTAGDQEPDEDELDEMYQGEQRRRSSKRRQLMALEADEGEDYGTSSER